VADEERLQKARCSIMSRAALSRLLDDALQPIYQPTMSS